MWKAHETPEEPRNEVTGVGGVSVFLVTAGVLDVQRADGSDPRRAGALDGELRQFIGCFVTEAAS